MSWAWWDWPLTSLTNHHPSVLWRCWLGHLTRKIVSEMTYNVSSGTLNTTIPYPWQNWMAAYLGYTLRMRTLFRGIMVNYTHTRRRRIELFLCYSIVCSYIGAQWYEQFLQVGWLYRALILLGLPLYLLGICIFRLSGAMCICNFFLVTSFSLHFSELAWWDWPLTQLTNHRPSVLWHCSLGHVTCKIVPEMTYIMCRVGR